MDAYLQERLELVKALTGSEGLPVAYGDCVLITCAVIGACAAQRWPGTGIDSKRFVELLVRNSAEQFRSSWVSVPSLLSSGLIAETETPYGDPTNECRVFLDEDIDLSFGDARAKYPCVDIKKLRGHCYASLIYKSLRCPYAHEYRIAKDLSAMSATESAARVSYMGQVANIRSQGIRRRAHFHLPYLVELAQHQVALATSSPEPPPQQWWCDMP
ncbi:MAG: hypothetical protein AABZ53_16075 [Planctomycetota bacterium]